MSDKIQQLRDALDGFETFDDALRAAWDLRVEKVHAKHAAKTRAFGSVAVTNWAGLKEYYDMPPEDQPDVRQLSAELVTAFANEDATRLFEIFASIAKAVKPYDQYQR